MYFIERTTIAANLLRQIGLASICEYSFGMFFSFLSIIFQFPERVRPLFLNSAILITITAKYDSHKSNYVLCRSYNFNNYASNFSLSMGSWLLIAPEFRFVG